MKRLVIVACLLWGASVEAAPPVRVGAGDDPAARLLSEIAARRLERVGEVKVEQSANPDNADVVPAFTDDLIRRFAPRDWRDALNAEKKKTTPPLGFSTRLAVAVRRDSPLKRLADLK